MTVVTKPSTPTVAVLYRVSIRSFFVYVLVVAANAAGALNASHLINLPLFRTMVALSAIATLTAYAGAHERFSTAIVSRMSGWRYSSYVILAATFALLGTAVTLAVGSEAAAHRVATYAYYLLIVGLALRLIERIAF